MSQDIQNFYHTQKVCQSFTIHSGGSRGGLGGWLISGINYIRYWPNVTGHSEFLSYREGMPILGQIKKIPLFRASRFYLNLLMKLFFFSGFLGKKYNFMHFERQNAFQNSKNYFYFSEKKICVPTLPKNFRPVTRNTHFFIWPYTILSGRSRGGLGGWYGSGINCISYGRVCRSYTILSGGSRGGLGCWLVTGINCISYWPNVTGHLEFLSYREGM